MYKCGNKECKFIITDGILSFNCSPKIENIVKNNRCPECRHELIYKNELLEQCDKYKKHMR